MEKRFTNYKVPSCAGSLLFNWPWMAKGFHSFAECIYLVEAAWSPELHDHLPMPVMGEGRENLVCEWHVCFL